MITQVQRHWFNRWVWFDPGDGSDVQKGLVTLLSGRGEVYVSYDFEVDGCYTLPVCTVHEIDQVLTLVEGE